MALRITVAAQTDIGRVRKQNQDSFGIEPDLLLYIICDGMGGAAGGEVASRLAVDAFVARFNSPSPTEPPDDLLCHAAMAANSAILARAILEPALRGMGSTLVAAHVHDRHLHLVNIGDSRAYLLRNGDCTQLTVDHSYLQEQVRLGLMSQAAADESPMQSVITRAVGVHEDMQPDLSGLDLQPGDFILLTSDGLTRHVKDSELAAIVAAPAPDPTDRPPAAAALDLRCKTLIELAKKRGGSDNITCILLHARAE